jgi:RNA polymerase sigma-70 factor (ECF subfamily)
VPFEDELSSADAKHFSSVSLEDRVADADALSQSLEGLDPKLREALLLVVSQGMTYREAAEITGEPIGTVKWRVWKATQIMRGILENESEEIDGV